MLPRCGDGHQIEGWPIEAIPVEVWHVVDLYLMCGEYHLPGGPSLQDQDAWTMDAFMVLRSTDEQITTARGRAWRISQGMPPDG